MQYSNTLVTWNERVELRRNKFFYMQLRWDGCKWGYFKKNQIQKHDFFVVDCLVLPRYQITECKITKASNLIIRITNIKSQTLKKCKKYKNTHTFMMTFNSFIICLNRKHSFRWKNLNLFAHLKCQNEIVVRIPTNTSEFIKDVFWIRSFFCM